MAEEQLLVVAALQQGTTTQDVDQVAVPHSAW